MTRGAFNGSSGGADVVQSFYLDFGGETHRLQTDTTISVDIGQRSEHLLPDGSLWSHAATLGSFLYAGERIAITEAMVRNFVQVFATGYPRKVPIDYNHDSADGAVVKAGTVLEMRAVLSEDDVAGDAAAPIRAQILAAHRELSDPENFGLWVRWVPTPSSLKMLRQRETTEMSIEWADDVVNIHNGEHQGPTILAIALTNRPHLDGMVPIAASRARATAARPGATGAHRISPREEESMNKLFTFLSAKIGRTVQSEEDAQREVDAEITRLSSTNTTLTQQLAAVKPKAEGFDALAAELGESDPVKAVASVRTLKQAKADADKAAETARKTARAAEVEGALKKFERKLTVPTKKLFAAALERDLDAGQKLGETETEKALATMPDIVGGQRSAVGDANAPTDRSTKLAARASAILAEDPKLAEQAKTNHNAAYKVALSRAQSELVG